MSQDVKLPSIYVVVKEIPPNEEFPAGSFKFSIASNIQTIETMANDGFRVFQLGNEMIFHKIECQAPVVEESAPPQ